MLTDSCSSYLFKADYTVFSYTKQSLKASIPWCSQHLWQNILHFFYCGMTHRVIKTQSYYFFVSLFCMVYEHGSSF